MNKNIAIEMLDSLSNEDNFGPDGILYTGVQDRNLKNRLSTDFSSTILDFKNLVMQEASDKELLELLQSSINKFDREQLDTEDAENLTSKFEQIMDCIGLESSDGILNDWMYGFDVN